MAASSPSDSRFSGYGNSPSPHARSIVDDEPEWLRGFEASKKTKDGEPPKRRGPKPDSKPAATKRQEMNRLAQRTHRERKDQYAQELEWRVLRAKDAYLQLVREKEELKQENREMAQLLQANGISYQSSFPRKPSLSQNGSIYTASSTGSMSGGSSTRAQTVEGSPYTAPLSLNGSNGVVKRASHSPGNPNIFPAYSPAKAASMPSQTPIEPPGFSSQAPIGMAITTDRKASSTSSLAQSRELSSIFKDDQISLDFVLHLEGVCQDHKKMMCVRGTNANPTQLSGHALMHTCPPDQHYRDNPDDDEYHKFPGLPNPELMRLLALSYDLPLSGEMAPVQALQIIRTHERASELTLRDFKALTERLYKYMNCYGFGAVIAEYALREELAKLFDEKDQQRSMALGLNGLAVAVPTASILRPRANGVVNQTTCNGEQYTYQQLAGYGFVPSNARDSYGDTLGGFGSSVAIDQKTWKKLKNGTYTGTLYAIPDRG
ncbi:MAG: hypothetical protein Q9194_005152, partial [Teloschistes cf. exilis]